jgi:hypothetical protein
VGTHGVGGIEYSEQRSGPCIKLGSYTPTREAAQFFDLEKS